MHLRSPTRDRRSPVHPSPVVRPPDPRHRPLRRPGRPRTAPQRPLPAQVERAWAEFWEAHGISFAGDWAAAGDACNAVKELRITYGAPVTRPGAYAVHLWLERLGTTGLTYGFRFCSTDGVETYAHGTRVLVRLDATTLRPAPWSEEFRAAGRTLLRSAD